MIGRSLLTMMRIVSLYLMPGFVPGIRAFLASSFRMARERQTRNLEIPGSRLRIAPE